MKDKPTTPERDLPPQCANCRSLYKECDTIICAKNRLYYQYINLYRQIPIIGRLAPTWECDLRKYETVEDTEEAET